VSEEDLAAIEARCAAAQPGPWTWIHDRLNERIFTVGKNGNRRARPGHKIRETWVGLLAGPVHGALAGHEERADGFDYPHVLALRWWQVAGTSLHGPVMPFRDDAAFIAAARADVPALVAEVRRLREEIRVRLLEEVPA
jgi:hypothetical protein